MGKASVVIRVIMFLLGIFEFFIVAEILSTPLDKMQPLYQKHFLYPPSWFDIPNRYLLVIFTLFLGLLRICWATSNGGWGPWLCLCATHSFELVFVWTLALSAHFNPHNYDLSTLVQKVINFEVGTRDSSVVLMVVPVLFVLSILHGPSRFNGLLGGKVKNN